MLFLFSTKHRLLGLIIIISIPFSSQHVHLKTVPFRCVIIGKHNLYNFILILDRFRIVTWNVGNEELDCDTFELLAFGSNFDNSKPDLIVFGYENY